MADAEPPAKKARIASSDPEAPVASAPEPEAADASSPSPSDPPPVDIGVFIPIGNNGWLISTTSPQYQPSFALNKRVVQLAESHSFDFALSMIKLRGFGGASEFWDHNLESLTLTAALAAVTTRIRLFASTAILTLPPALVARMASTIDSVAGPDRFGLNIVTGWQPAEYTQMGLWPGDAYFGYRYAYAAEYVTVLRDLWSAGVSDFKGEHFAMTDCKLSPRPAAGAAVPIVAAGQSGRGLDFAARHADFNFAMGSGLNTPAAHAKATSNLVDAAAAAERDVGAYVLFMLIAAPTSSDAHARWRRYNDGADKEALAWVRGQTSRDAGADEASTAHSIALPDGAVNMNMGTLVGDYAEVAGMLDEAAAIPGTKGIMLTFDDFVEGIDAFGKHIQPLMKSRRGKVKAQAETETKAE